MAKVELKPTHARVWRRAREEGYVFTLPSGKVARLRPVALDALILSGKIPNLLIPVVAKMLWTTAGEKDDRPEEEIKAEQKKYFVELVSIIAPAAMIYPSIVDNPEDEDEIHLDDLTFGDKLAIYTLAKLPAEVLEEFCSQQSSDVEPVPASEELRPATEPAN